MRSKPGTAERAPAALLAALLVAACAPAAPPDPEVRELAAFGTLVTLRAWNAPAARVDAALATLEADYRRLERDWYPWADGELAAINAAIARGEPAAVSAPLRALLERAAGLERRSLGLFNPALGRLTELWGFHEPGRQDWRPPAAAAIAELLAARPSAARLAWDGARLTSTTPELALDPGGIAKGALLARSAERLGAAGIDDAIIDLGGDLLVIGRAGGRAARIGIRRPGGRDALAWLEAESGEAVMTSGDYERYFEHAGRRYAHVLDPASGHPAEGTASATVVARDPLLADAAATALLVGGSARFDELVAALGLDYALIVTASGDVRLTPAMAGRLHWLSDPVN